MRGHGSMFLKLPVPKLAVLYNGEDNRPDETILRLSDYFPVNADSDIEVRVRMLNINHGRNAALLKACQPLQEYSWFIAQIRQNKAKAISDDSATNLTYAVNQASLDMPNSFVIKPFLLIHQSEVLGMLLTEYDEIEMMKMVERDAHRKGVEEGQIRRIFFTRSVHSCRSISPAVFIVKMCVVCICKSWTSALSKRGIFQ